MTAKRQKRTDPEPASLLELIPPRAPTMTAPREPEQLPLRLLTVISRGVESIQTELHEIRAALPAQRRPLSRRAQAIHIRVIATRRNGLCPCCQAVPVCTEAGKLPGAEFDHWYSRNQNRISQTWLTCHECNVRLVDSDFKAAARSAFEAYQQALRPFLSRQLPLGLSE